MEPSENTKTPSTDQKKDKLDLNGVATVVAVVLSLVAISISVLEVSTMRMQQKASVWPYLQISGRYVDNRYSIVLENKGVGPALIQDLALFVDDKEAGRFDKIIEDLVGKENAFGYDKYRVSNPNGSVVSSREKIELISVPLKEFNGSDNDFTPGIMFAQQSAKRLNLSICYCSIYEDCWQVDLKGSGASEIKNCPANY
jgi:hypothetical protein